MGQLHTRAYRRLLDHYPDCDLHPRLVIAADAVEERARDAGYSGWYVLEQDSVVEEEPPEGEGPVEEVGKSLAYLRERLE